MSNDSSRGKSGSDKAPAKRFGFRKRLGIGFGHPVRIILTLLFIFISSQIAAAVITQSGLSLSGRNIDDIFESAAAQFIFILLAEAMAVYLVFWVLRRRGLKFESIGLGRSPLRSDLVSGFLAFLIFYVILAVVFAMVVALFPEAQTKLNEPQEIGFNALNSSLDKILAFTALVILAPIGEEIMVRGYLFSGLRSHWNFLPAAIVTGVVFGAAHLQPENPGALVWGAALSTFVLSFVLAYLRERTGALYSSVLVHGMNNAVAFTVYFTTLSF